MIWPDGYLGPDSYVDYERFLEPGNDYGRGVSRNEVPKSWMTQEQGKAIQDFVMAGNGFYALHNSSHISLSSQSYREVMGGAYIGHPPLRPFMVHVTNKEHPITRGVNDFIVNDVQHFVEYDKGANNIFLRSENIDGLEFERHGTKSIAGWAHEYGKGRVVFTAPGSNIPAMWQPEYLKLQKNAVRWLLKMT
jgi:type 1 glutamine amidotransferase